MFFDQKVLILCNILVEGTSSHIQKCFLSANKKLNCLFTCDFEVICLLFVWIFNIRPYSVVPKYWPRLAALEPPKEFI